MADEPDEITNLQNQLDNYKGKVLFHLNQELNQNYDTENLDKYSPWFVQQQWTNYKNNIEPNQDPQMYQYDNFLDRINKTVNQINTDYRNKDKVMGTLYNRIVNGREGEQRTAPQIDWNYHTWNYNQYKPWDGMTPPNNARTMGLDVLWWHDDERWLKNFEQQYSKPDTDTVKYQLDNGKTVYLPVSYINKGDIHNDTTSQKDIHSCWDLVKEYQQNKNNADLYKNMANNMFHNVWNNTLHNSEDYINKGVHDQFLDDLNNHPIHNIPDLRNISKALGQYNYRIQKQRIWQQYHQNQLDFMAQYLKHLTSQRNTIQSKINDLCHWHGKYYSDNSRYTDHHLIHDKKRVQQIDALAKQRADLNFMINNRLPNHGNNYYEFEIRMRDEAKGNADKLAHALPSLERQTMDQAYLDATIDNINADPRHGKFAFIAPRNPVTEDSYVFMMVTEESPTHETEATTNPVEWGRNITTSTQKQATQVEISGYLFNNNLPQHADNGYASHEPNDGHGLDPVKKDDHSISGWADDGAEMFYCGTNIYPHCIITEWNPDYNLSGDGGSLTSCQFSMTLQLADYFESNTIQQSGSKHGRSNKKGTKGKKKGRKSSKKKRVRGIRIKAGMTFYGVSQKTGVPVSKLERLNSGMRARDLRIGAIMKV